MAIKRYNIIITFEVEDTETKNKLLSKEKRVITTYYPRKSVQFIELVDVAVEEMLETLDEELCEVEELTKYKVEVQEA